MRVGVIVALACLAAILGFLSLDLGRVGAWAIEAQRGFQNQMATAVRALKAGDPFAYGALLSATAAYGFVHALGPGHGKYLVGGVGLGTRISIARLVGLAAISSLAQSIWAIVLVYGGFAVLQISAHQITGLAEDFLAPASYLAITAVGVILIWRGVRALPKSRAPALVGEHHGSAHPHSHDHRSHNHVHLHDHGHDDCGCHAHGPTPQEAARVTSLREAAGLVASIAVRPCTGAIFLLVIAWQMDIKMAGALAVVVMGLGTAALTSLVAVSSVFARGVAYASSRQFNALPVALPALQIFSGALVALFSLGLLGILI